MSELQLLLWMAGIHLAGFIAVGILMIPALRDSGEPPVEGEGETGGSDDGWGNLPRARPGSGGRPGGGIPLPDAEQSRVRLREPGRLADHRRGGRERRPVRDPAHPTRPTRSPARAS